jgi:hypothetical protein
MFFIPFNFRRSALEHVAAVVTFDRLARQTFAMGMDMMDFHILSRIEPAAAGRADTTFIRRFYGFAAKINKRRSLSGAIFCHRYTLPVRATKFCR